MAGFKSIIQMNEEELIDFVHKIRNVQIPMDERLDNIAKKT